LINKTKFGQNFILETKNLRIGQFGCGFSLFVPSKGAGTAGQALCEHHKPTLQQCGWFDKPKANHSLAVIIHASAAQSIAASPLVARGGTERAPPLPLRCGAISPGGNLGPTAQRDGVARGRGVPRLRRV